MVTRCACSRVTRFDRHIYAPGLWGRLPMPPNSPLPGCRRVHQKGKRVDLTESTALLSCWTASTDAPTPSPSDRANDALDGSGRPDDGLRLRGGQSRFLMIQLRCPDKPTGNAILQASSTSPGGTGTPCPILPATLRSAQAKSGAPRPGGIAGAGRKSATPCPCVTGAGRSHTWTAHQRTTTTPTHGRSHLTIARAAQPPRGLSAIRRRVRYRPTASRNGPRRWAIPFLPNGSGAGSTTRPRQGQTYSDGAPRVFYPPGKRVSRSWPAQSTTQVGRATGGQPAGPPPFHSTTKSPRRTPN